MVFELSLDRVEPDLVLFKLRDGCFGTVRDGVVDVGLFFDGLAVQQAAAAAVMFGAGLFDRTVAERPEAAGHNRFLSHNRQLPDITRTCWRYCAKLDSQSTDEKKPL